MNKEKNIDSKRRALVVVLAVALAIATVTIVVAAAVGGNMKANQKGTSSNPDDAREYIVISQNDKGGYEYSALSVDVETSLPVGTIHVDGDYMYVFGMAYNGSNTANVSTTSTTNWVRQATVTGWGCVAIDKTKTVYAAPLGVIENTPVTDFTKAYAGCTKMVDMPLIPGTAQVTTEMFAGCTSLKSANIQSARVIGTKMFSGCTSLEWVFIGSSVETIVAASSTGAPFYGVKSTCVCYCDKATAPSGWGSYWKTGFASVSMNADLILLLS